MQAKESASTAGLIGFEHSDLVLALVAPAGTDLAHVVDALSDQLKRAGYSPFVVRISSLLSTANGADPRAMREADRIAALRDAGDEMRRRSGDNAVLADGAAREIKRLRGDRVGSRQAFILSSLKHPDEVRRLRRIYAGGFFVIGVLPDDPMRDSYLKRKGVADDEWLNLIERDQDDTEAFGQKVSDTFHLADFFIRVDGSEPRLQGDLKRVCHILFGDPFATPSFDEYAMFLAFASSVSSGDISRQVGAVIARGSDILCTGANDVPSPNGGQYWPLRRDGEARGDAPNTRDYVAGGDHNRGSIALLIEQMVRDGRDAGLDPDILDAVLKRSALRDITEYQRAVHAEMHALMSAARNGVVTRGATLYCTTFPCHNCAKHIVAAGISRVLYIEPYRKSRALTMHGDAITSGPAELSDRALTTVVRFEPFFGVGPRRFFDFFSTRFGTGGEIDRKQFTQTWELGSASTLRIQMRPASYLQMEEEAVARFESRG